MFATIPVERNLERYMVEKIEHFLNLYFSKYLCFYAEFLPISIVSTLASDWAVSFKATAGNSIVKAI